MSTLCIRERTRQQRNYRRIIQLSTHLLKQLRFEAHLHAVIEPEDDVIFPNGIVLRRKVVEDLGARSDQLGRAELVVLALLLKGSHVNAKRAQLKFRRLRGRAVHVTTEHGRYVGGLQLHRRS